MGHKDVEEGESPGAGGGRSMRLSPSPWQPPAQHAPAPSAGGKSNHSPGSILFKQESFPTSVSNNGAVGH